MKTIIKTLPWIISLLSTHYGVLSYAANTYDEIDDISKSMNNQESILSQIETDLTNLGAYFGYPIHSSPDPKNVHDDLYNLKETITSQYNLVQNLYASLAVSPVYATFIANPLYTNINQLANQVFNSSSEINQQSAKTKINSKPYTPYPVAQSIQNILSITPDAYCYKTRDKCDSPTKNDWNSNCEYTFTQTQFYASALGLDNANNSYLISRLPAGKCSVNTENNEYMNSLGELLRTDLGGLLYPKSNNNNQKLLSQLDSSVLTSPLLYDTQEDSNGTSGSTNTSDAYQAEFPFGLSSKNNSEAAENYVKYVTGNILPPEPVQKNEYEQIMKNIYEASDISAQLNSFRELSKYMIGLRVYASRVSVAIQNIYEILGARKKVPNSGQDETQTSSQALNEFKMATYRLYNPSVNANSQLATTSDQPSTWQQMINDASPARIQKETAILLAEINYQLYLMRKQQEKLLLTNSVMLLQAATAPTLNVPNSEDTGSDDENSDS
jgi:intracellular multiplication protein IcmX